MSEKKLPARPSDEPGATARISNRATFDIVTGDPRQIAGLYYYRMLDCLFELSYKISEDFFARPHLYIDVGGTDVAGRIGRLHVEYGHGLPFLDKTQRDAIYRPLFGEEIVLADHYTHDFMRNKKQLLEAAAAYAERVHDSGIDMLRERVRAAHRPFKEYLAGLHGDALKWTKEFVFPQLANDFSYVFFRTKGIAAVFSLAVVPREQWPYTEDSNGDKLVEEVAGHFHHGDSPRLTREAFSSLQRAALRGAEALAAVLDFDEAQSDDALSVLITKCYTWRAAIGSLPDLGNRRELPTGRLRGGDLVPIAPQLRGT